jgi:hypothetical protein
MLLNVAMVIRRILRRSAVAVAAIAAIIEPGGIEAE